MRLLYLTGFLSLYLGIVYSVQPCRISFKTTVLSLFGNRIFDLLELFNDLDLVKAMFGLNQVLIMELQEHSAPTDADSKLSDSELLEALERLTELERKRQVKLNEDSTLDSSANDVDERSDDISELQSDLDELNTLMALRDLQAPAATDRWRQAVLKSYKRDFQKRYNWWCPGCGINKFHELKCWLFNDCKGDKSKSNGGSLST